MPALPRGIALIRRSRRAHGRSGRYGRHQEQSDFLPEQWLPSNRARCSHSGQRKVLGAAEMSNGNGRLYRDLRISGSLIIAGLLVELLSLIKVHPLAFLSFMFLGGA